MHPSMHSDEAAGFSSQKKRRMMCSETPCQETEGACFSCLLNVWAEVVRLGVLTSLQGGRQPRQPQINELLSPFSIWNAPVW